MQDRHSGEMVDTDSTQGILHFALSVSIKKTKQKQWQKKVKLYIGEW